jgi:hypothetical protein
MKKWLSLFAFVCSLTAYGQQGLTTPIPDCSLGFCSGLGIPTFRCNSGQKYAQVDNPGHNFTCTGIPPAWVADAGGGGGGGTPAAPSFAVQFANSGASAFQADTNFLINPTTHSMTTVGGNVQTGALDSLPRRVFDPMNTERSGGLAAAIAGTSGFTPTQVIQATLDYAECQGLMSSPAVLGSRVILPTGIGMNVGQILLWTHQELSGESDVNQPTLQHNDSSKPMIALHGHADTITCSNGTTYTPGAPGGVVIKNINISGMGTSTSKDIGIELAAPSDGFHCVACRISHVAGGSQAFGGQGVLLLGTSVFADHIGYEDAQINGCQVYTHGTEPVTNSPTGKCGAIEDDVLDGEFDYGYATDSAQFLAGRGPGACYPNCAGFVFGGLNGHINHVFSQVSDVGILAGGTSARFGDGRVDAVSREGILITGGGGIINGFTITNPCTSVALQTNYNAGVATGCFGVSSGGWSGLNGVNQITDVQVGTNNGLFGASFAQASFEDGVLAATTPDYFNLPSFVPNADNLTANDWPIFYNGGGGGLPPIVSYTQSLSATVHTGTANIAGVAELFIGTSTPLANVIGGIQGQIVTIYASSTQGTATINHHPNNNGFSPFGIITCSGLPEAVTSTQGSVFQYTINNLSEVGCNTQGNHLYVNWSGNPTPTAPSFIDFYGNAQARQSPAQSPVNFLNLHGATTGGQACFELESVFPDGSHVVGPLSCTNVNLAAQTPGSIFASLLPQSTTNLWLVSNAQGNGVPIGKYPAPFVLAGIPPFWDGPTVIAAGGNGVTAPPAGDNNTGEFWAANGVLLSTAGTQPTCAAEYQGLQWVVRNSTTGDVPQVCAQQAGGAFAWQTLGGGGSPGLVYSSPTLNAIPVVSSTSGAGTVIDSSFSDNGTITSDSESFQLFGTHYLEPTNTATGSNNFPSNPIQFLVSYWNGTAAVNTNWQQYVTVGTGTSPATTLNFFSPPEAPTDTFNIAINPTQAATSGANLSSPKVTLGGAIWNGSASVADVWTAQNVESAGTNPTSTYTFSHAGSSGAAVVSVPQLQATGGTPGINNNGAQWTGGTSLPGTCAIGDFYSLTNATNAGSAMQVCYPVNHWNTLAGSPLLQWTSFNSTTFSGASAFGLGSELVTAPSSTATITREDLVLATAPAGCTTNAVVTLYDETNPASPGEASSTLRITLANGTRFYTVTPGSPFTLTLGHNYMWGILTAAAGCTTSPAGPSWTVTYTVQ